MGKVEKLKKTLLKEYKNKDILIMLEGFIKTYIIIKNSKILINNQTLILTDGKQQEIIIDLDYVYNIDVNTAIMFDLDNEKITLQY